MITAQKILATASRELGFSTDELSTNLKGISSNPEIYRLAAARIVVIYFLHKYSDWDSKMIAAWGGYAPGSISATASQARFKVAEGSELHVWAYNRLLNALWPTDKPEATAQEEPAPEPAPESAPEEPASAAFDRKEPAGEQLVTSREAWDKIRAGHLARAIDIAVREGRAFNGLGAEVGAWIGELQEYVEDYSAG